MQIGNTLAVSSQASQKYSNVKTRVVCDQTVIANGFGDVRPMRSKRRHVLDVLRTNAVNADIDWRKVERFGTDHPHRRIHDFALANFHRSQLACTIGSSICRFEVDGCEIGRKVGFDISGGIHLSNFDPLSRGVLNSGVLYARRGKT